MGLRTRAALITCLCGLVAVGVAIRLLWKVRAAAGPEAAAAPAGDGDLAAIGAELAALRNEVRALRAQAKQPQRPVAVAASSCDPGTPGPTSGDIATVMERAYDRAQTESTTLDDKLVHEPRDQAWAAEYEQTLRRATESALSDPATEVVARTECRSTMCRIEVKHADGGQEAAFRNRFRMQLPDTIYRVSQAEDGTGSHATVLHVLRKGQPIPHEASSL